MVRAVAKALEATRSTSNQTGTDLLNMAETLPDLIPDTSGVFVLAPI
jgi:hypothetical protein